MALNTFTAVNYDCNKEYLRGGKHSPWKLPQLICHRRKLWHKIFITLGCDYNVKTILWPNEDKSVARFCRQVAAVVTGMFFLNNKMAYNSTTTGAREKMSRYLESLEFLNLCLIKQIKNQVLIHKIC